MRRGLEAMVALTSENPALEVHQDKVIAPLFIQGYLEMHINAISDNGKHDHGWKTFVLVLTAAGCLENVFRR
jgi:hypothetical protein